MRLPIFKRRKGESKEGSNRRVEQSGHVLRQEQEWSGKLGKAAGRGGEKWGRQVRDKAGVVEEAGGAEQKVRGAT